MGVSHQKKVNPKDAEKQPQQEHKYNGGEEGDGSSGSGGSAAVAAGLGDVISGDFTAGAFVIGVRLVLAGAYLTWVFSPGNHDRPTSKSSDTPPKPLPNPTEPFDMAMFAALDKKFDRWIECTDLDKARPPSTNVL